MSGSDENLIGLERTCVAVFTSQKDNRVSENHSSIVCKYSRAVVPSLIDKKVKTYIYHILTAILVGSVCFSFYKMEESPVIAYFLCEIKSKFKQ